MQLLHLVAACLFPGAMSKETKTTISEPSEPDNASSMAFSVETPDSASSISSSSSSSSDGDHHPRFFPSRPQSPSTSPAPLCFGAGGAARWLLRRTRGARARSPPKQAAAASVAPAVKRDDVVGWYLRKISRRLRKARTPGMGSPPPGCGADDTARERAESVARAVAYCKDTLRRGGVSPPRPPPSPSLDDWLHDRQKEIMASAAAYCNECTESPPSRSRLDGLPAGAAHGGIEGRVSPPRPHRAGGISEMPAMEKEAKELTGSPSPNRESSITASDVEHGHDTIDSRFLYQGHARLH